MNPAPEDAAICPDSVRELRHVIAAYAAMGDVDVVHDHTTVGPFYHRVPGSIPVVTTNHGPFDADSIPLFRAMRDVAVIAISQNQASTADGVDIARVIHHGIDVDSVPIGSGDGGYASFLGRMSPDKGAREAALIAREAGVPLRMAAKLREPAEHDYFDAEVRPLLSDEVEYVGEVDEEEKLKLVGESFAMLNPLKWPEPFGLVMIEALATGTPVVSTPPGSVPEIIEDGVTGYLREEASQLAAALIEAQQLDRDRCRAEAQRRFSTKRMVDDHIQLYSELRENH